MDIAAQRPRTWCGSDVFRPGTPVWLPLIVLFSLSVIFRFSELDLALQHKFWSPADGWRLASNPAIQALYRYGTWPAAIAGGLGVVFWLGSTLTGRHRETRSLGLFLALLLVIGPGLIINLGFKDHFGRSRPRQVQDFGGDQPYRPLGSPGPEDGGKSFPSGHASMGFYWLGLFIYFWDRRRRLALGFGAFGILHGLLVGFGRMAQGAHWPSDILWSAGFVYLTAWGLNALFLRRSAVRGRQQTQAGPALAAR